MKSQGTKMDLGWSVNAIVPRDAIEALPGGSSNACPQEHTENMDRRTCVPGLPLPGSVSSHCQVYVYKKGTGIEHRGGVTQIIPSCSWLILCSEGQPVLYKTSKTSPVRTQACSRGHVCAVCICVMCMHTHLIGGVLWEINLIMHI